MNYDISFSGRKDAAIKYVTETVNETEMEPNLRAPLKTSLHSFLASQPGSHVSIQGHVAVDGNYGGFEFKGSSWTP